jgi:hypothetical protein
VTLSAGTRLGPYELVAPVGAGGMGEVYRGRDMRLERTENSGRQINVFLGWFDELKRRVPSGKR